MVCLEGSVRSLYVNQDIFPEPIRLCFLQSSFIPGGQLPSGSCHRNVLRFHGTMVLYARILCRALYRISKRKAGHRSDRSPARLKNTFLLHGHCQYDTGMGLKGKHYTCRDFCRNDVPFYVGESPGNPF